jgi:hypothetical protein
MKKHPAARAGIIKVSGIFLYGGMKIVPVVTLRASMAQKK